MKKWFFLLLVVALLSLSFASFTNAATRTVSKAAAVSPKLVLDGNVLKSAIAPVLMGNFVMVPVRTVAENLGYKVDYNNKKKQVALALGSSKVQMTLDQKTALVNGEARTLEKPPTIKSGSTLIPLRFVSEAFGVQVYWDNADKSAYLYSSDLPGNGAIGIGDDEGGTGAGGGVLDGGNPTPSPSPTPTPTPTPLPTSAVINSHVHEIRYEPDAVVIKYDGVVAPLASVLTNPDRILIDLPDSDFAPDMVPAYTMTSDPWKSGELAVDGHAALQKVRFATYQDNPRVLRVVLDLNQRWGYTITNDPTVGEIRVWLSPPTSQPTSPPTSAPSTSTYTIVLDAGHGGSDPGAKSITGRWEKDFNLAVVLKVQALLANEPRIRLVLTRQGDTYPTLDDRVNLANSLKADLFLSVHANSYTAATNGTETYYNRPDSLAFATLLHQNVTTADKLKDNHVRTANYKVIKATTMPAVLEEVGYLTNANDEKNLFDDGFQNRVAQAIADSFKQYFKLF